MKRHENSDFQSSIRAILTWTGAECGLLGPRFGIQKWDYQTQEFPRPYLADFLNKATGRYDGKPIISPTVAKGIFEDFSEILVIDNNGEYKYIGPQLIDKSKHAWEFEKRAISFKDDFDKYISIKDFEKHINKTHSYSSQEEKNINQDQDKTKFYDIRYPDVKVIDDTVESTMSNCLGQNDDPY